MKRGVLALPSTAADSMDVDGMIDNIAASNGVVELLVDLEYKFDSDLNTS